MITDGFIYIAILVFAAALAVNLPGIFKGKGAARFFRFVPPVVLIYLGLMMLCSLKLWDLSQTQDAYSAIKNPLLYAMLFLMLLRCDLRKIARLGGKMLIGFFCATVSIAIGFIVSYALMSGFLGEDAWSSLGALCGSWMGGGGNMLAIQAALDVEEAAMAYPLVTDSVCATVYIMFLLWVIGFAPAFNKWTKADTHLIDEIGSSLQAETAADTRRITWQSIILLLGLGLVVSALSQEAGAVINTYAPFFDKATWTVLVVTAAGVVLAMTRLGKIKGADEMSNVLLYVVIALIASRADIGSVGNAHLWILCGFLILFIHVVLMLIFAKLFKMDVFTCAVASLANIGGTATAPVLAGTYNAALVPVGIIMALLGYVIGSGGGLFVAYAMSVFA